MGARSPPKGKGVAVGVGLLVAVAVLVAVGVAVGVLVLVGVGVLAAALYVASSACHIGLPRLVLSVACAAYAPTAETTQDIPKSEPEPVLPTPPSDAYVGVPLAAQGFVVPFVPGLKPASDISVMVVTTPKSSSLGCVVVTGAPLDGDPLVPTAEAVWSRGALASPVTAKACTRSVKGAVPPDQVTVTVEFVASGAASPWVEQMLETKLLAPD
jgi:hypothetical protein